MSPRLSRRLALLAPALLGGFLWMGLPSPADAGGWKHGHHRHGKHHGKHHGRHHGWHRGGKHHGHPFRHHDRHFGWRGDHRAWYGGWYGGHRPHRHHHGYAYAAPVAVYLDGPCGFTYDSWDHFSHHVHHHHGVAFVDLPGLLVETSFGFAFHP